MGTSIVGGNVKRIMTERGLKHYVVAEKAGIPKQTFSNMLNGRKMVDEHAIASIACVLGVTPNDLFATDHPDQ